MHRHLRAPAAPQGAPTPARVSARLGALLKQHRRAAGLTQEQLAERAGYSPVAIRKFEQGTRIPLPDTLDRLTEALALAPDQRGALHLAAWHARHPAPEQTLPSSPRVPPLVGRARELARIERHLAGDGPPVLLFAGEPGIGKTRLLDETEQVASEKGWRVLRGGCTRRSGQEPYAPFVA